MTTLDPVCTDTGLKKKWESLLVPEWFSNPNNSFQGGKNSTLCDLRLAVKDLKRKNKKHNMFLVLV